MYVYSVNSYILSWQWSVPPNKVSSFNINFTKIAAYHVSEDYLKLT